MKSEPLANLVPLVEVAEGHFVTHHGTIGVACEATGINMSIMSADVAQAVADGFGAACNGLEPGYTVQVQGEIRSLRGEVWAPRHMRRYRDAPVHLRSYVADLGEDYHEMLDGSFVADTGYRMIVSRRLPGYEPRGPLSRLVGTLRPPKRPRVERAAYARAVAELEQAAAQLAAALGTIGVNLEPLGRQDYISLAHESLNPEWAESVPAPDPERARALWQRSHGGDPGDLEDLRTLLAQSRLVPGREHVRLDGAWERTIALRYLPDSTFAGMLDRLSACGRRVRFAWFYEAQDNRKVRASLLRRLRPLHAVLEERDTKGRVADVVQRQRRGEIEDQLERLGTSDDRVFRVAAFATVREDRRDQLKPAIADVARALRDTGGAGIDRLYGWQLSGWRATQPWGHNPAEMEFTVPTENLAHCMPFLHHRAGTPDGALLGFSEPGGQVVTLDLWSPTLPNPNALANGYSGSGKTMIALSYVTKEVATGRRRGLVIDLSPGHWEGPCALLRGHHHWVALDAGVCINPWDLAPEERRCPDGPPHRKVQYLLRLLRLMLGRPDERGVRALDPDDESLLDAGIAAVYRDSPAPRMSELHAWLASQPGMGAERLRYLLGQYVGRGVKAPLMDGETSVDPNAALEVFNLSRLDADTRPLAMMLLIEYLWSVIQRTDLRTVVVMDEGWSLLDDPATAAFVNETTRRGRHNKVVNINISQFASDYAGELGQAVLNTSATKFVLAQEPEQVGVVSKSFGLSDGEREIVSRIKPFTGERHAAYLKVSAGGDSGLVSLYVTPAEYWLFTSNPDEAELRRRALQLHGGDVWAAVCHLAATGGALPDDEHERPGLRVVGDGE